MKMLRLLRRTPKATLTNTALYNEQSFYNAFERDIKRAQSTVVIESPFLTEKRALYFARLFNKLARKGVKVRVNTRNPRHHDKPLEIQAWRSIRILRDNGVKVYFFSDMRHRKLAIIDQQILWEGSLNILSQVLSKEVMRRTHSAELAQQVAAFTKIHNRFW
jgi:phosphatidylserine/phosphatidylglycerophosphate/cardiolipin synthase-like enzyme